MSWRIYKTISFVLLAMFISSTVLAQGEERTVNIQPVEQNPVLSVGEDGTWDSVSVRFPHVLFHDGLYHMFYTAFTDIAMPQAIGYATSEDGITWTRYENNPILEGSGNGNFDDFGVNRPVVMVEDDGTWVMYYNGNSAPGVPPFGKGIGRATAPSPTGPWTRSETPVLEAGAARRWDGAFIFPDSVLKTDEGYVMYYSATGGSQGMVGMATSPDGITWTKYDDPATTERAFDTSDPVLPGGESGSWDGEQSWGAGVQITERGWEMTYTGGATLDGVYRAQVGYAYSDDGIHWTKYANNPIVSIDSNLTLFTSLLVHDGTYYVYYGLAPGNNNPITEANLAMGTVE